ncbi:hypothetical protein CDAR_373481 [Caerostris darwini]|uniref:Uncharacterized protein n=1 Tax=Caerostris darwini TaxID=1538125 RepID=A0AAV4QLH3_9ARAC|nr:hypothetical protein CDAR_373481 [Caerostris darwini]
MQSAKGFYDWEENAQCFGNMNMHFGSTSYCFMGHRLKYGRAESFPEARLAETAYFFKEIGIVLIMRGSSILDPSGSHTGNMHRVSGANHVALCENVKKQNGQSDSPMGKWTEEIKGRKEQNRFR